MISGPTVRLTHLGSPILHGRKHYLQTDQNEIPHDLGHQGIPSGASKMIFVPVVCLAQTIHLCCTDPNTISKRVKTRFHMTHIIEEFHRVRLKWFSSLWYVRCKPYTHLGSRLALPPNTPKWDSTWAMSPRSTIRCVKNDFWDYGTFGTNSAPILHQYKHGL
jgi:hypothetical protein